MRLGWRVGRRWDVLVIIGRCRVPDRRSMQKLKECARIQLLGSA